MSYISAPAQCPAPVLLPSAGSAPLLPDTVRSEVRPPVHQTWLTVSGKGNITRV